METNYEELAGAHSAMARERVAADLKTLTRDAEDLLKATAGDVSEKARAARERVGAALERARATCADLREQTAAVAKKRVALSAAIRTSPSECRSGWAC